MLPFVLDWKSQDELQQDHSCDAQLRKFKSSSTRSALLCFSSSDKVLTSPNLRGLCLQLSRRILMTLKDPSVSGKAKATTRLCVVVVAVLSL